MLIAFVLAIATLYFGSRIFIPLALALVFSFLLTPFVILLEKIHLGRVPAVITVLALAFVLAGSVAWGVAGQLVEIMADLPDYKINLDHKIQSLHASKDGTLSKATATVQELNKELAAVPGKISSGNSPEKRSERKESPIAVQLAAPPSDFVQEMRALVGPLARPVETAVIVLIFVAFMLVKREDLRNRLIRLAGRGQLNVMTQALDEAGNRLSRYLLLLCVVNVGYGLLFGLGLYFVGVPHALLWGVFAGLLRFVPYVGTVIGALLPVAMALAVFPGWRHAGLTFAVFLVLEGTVSNVIEPLLYGAHTGISSLAILVAAVFWATLWGPVGLILSTPLTVCLMVMGRYVPQLEFLDVLLGDEPVLPPEQHFYQRLLAMDAEEARTIAEAHIKENPLESLYASVLIPALRLAEQDHYNDGLADETRKFIYQSTKELVEDMDGRTEEDDNRGGGDNRFELMGDSGAPVPPRQANIACVPAREGSDELIAMMLAQMLRHAGFRAREWKSVAAEEIAAEVSRSAIDILCISALPPFAVGQARLLCKRLSASRPALRIVVGLWNIEGGAARAQERIGCGPGGVVATTLAEVLAEVQRFAGALSEMMVKPAGA